MKKPVKSGKWQVAGYGMLSLLAGGVFLVAFHLSLVTKGFAESYIGISMEEKQRLMQEHYTRAIQYFNEGNYTKAISHWEEILKIDPEQASPTTLIKQARAKLSDQMGPLEQEMYAAMASGGYETARAKAAELVEKDPTNQRYAGVRDKLERIVAIVVARTGNDRVSKLVRKGLSAHLSTNENPKLAINALRLAQTSAPNDGALPRLVTYVEEQYPDVAKREEVAPGMSVTEHKLFIALNHIYEGRYDLAIFACNEVLELEPDNVLALKRKGSAYFALNQKDKAREIWKQAFKLSPDDQEIKKFLTAK